MQAIPLLLALASFQERDDALARAVDAYTAPLEKAGYLSGMLLIARGDDILCERAFGQANYELGVPVGPETRFNIASITKPMTIALAVRLIEQEKLSVEDTLERWIPGFPNGERITVNHLLNHGAGFRHRVTTDAQEIVPRTAAEMAELAKLATPLYAPGERSEYSSAGYSVLARVLELAGGKSYGELLEEHVFAPLQMSHSAHASSRTLLPGRASSYFLSTRGPLNSPLKDLSFLVGAGSVWSTARDLYRLQRGVLHDELGPNVAYAFQAAAGLDWNGLTNGYRAFADYHALDDLHVIFTSNMHTGAADLLRVALPRLARGEELPPAEAPPVAVIDLDPAVHSACEGVYSSGPGHDDLPFQISDGLVLCGERVLWPTSANTFFSPADFGTVTVQKDEKGVPGKLSWVGPGFSLAWEWAGPLPALR